MEITVRVPDALSRHTKGRRILELEVQDEATVEQALDALALEHPAVERSVRDEAGVVRPHINLFVDAIGLRDLGGLEHRLQPGAQILVLPAVSGGA